jgi:hypothetical protein
MMTDDFDGSDVGRTWSWPGVFQWALLLLKTPYAFFARMAKSGGYAVPIFYAVVWSFVTGVLELIVSLIRPQPFRMAPAAEAIWILFGPWVVLLIGFVLSGILFAIWNIMGSRENYQTAFRCWAFTTPLSAVGAVLGLVRYLNIGVLAYGFFLVFVASVVVHGIPRKKAAVVWSALCACLVLGMLLVLAWARAARARGLTPDGMIAPIFAPSKPAAEGGVDMATVQEIRKQIEAELKKRQEKAK